MIVKETTTYMSPTIEPIVDDGPPYKHNNFANTKNGECVIDYSTTKVP